MRYRRLGRSGLKVSELALGGWFKEGVTCDERMLHRLLEEALERGINLIDLADIYGNGETEQLFGRLLKNYPRHQLVISTKCFWPMSQGINDCGLSRKHITESVNGSLKRLHTDYIDLFLCHAEDLETPLEETVRAIDTLIRQGKILYWGVCGWQQRSIQYVIELCEELNVPRPINQQLAYNLLERFPEQEQLEYAEHLGMGVTAWSPFAGGILAKSQSQFNQPNRQGTRSEVINSLWKLQDLDIRKSHRVLESFANLAQDASVTRAQLALFWILRRKEVASVILGMSSSEQLQDNLRVLELEISDDILTRLDQVFTL